MKRLNGIPVIGLGCYGRTGPEGLLAAGAMLTPGKRVESFHMWGGRPAKFMRELDQNWAEANRLAVAHYVQNGQNHKAANQG